MKKQIWNLNVNYPEEKMMAVLDGQKTYRILKPDRERYQIRNATYKGICGYFQRRKRNRSTDEKCFER